jgi:flagellin-like hook-associated protein FlgL
LAIYRFTTSNPKIALTNPTACERLSGAKSGGALNSEESRPNGAGWVRDAIMSNPLLPRPCPFCNSTSIVVKQNTAGALVYCVGCGAEIAKSNSRKAVSAWNRRAEEPEQDATEAKNTALTEFIGAVENAIGSLRRGSSASEDARRLTEQPVETLQSALDGLRALKSSAGSRRGPLHSADEA